MSQAGNDSGSYRDEQAGWPYHQWPGEQQTGGPRRTGASALEEHQIQQALHTHQQRERRWHNRDEFSGAPQEPTNQGFTPPTHEGHTPAHESHTPVGHSSHGGYPAAGFHDKPGISYDQQTSSPYGASPAASRQEPTSRVGAVSAAADQFTQHNPYSFTAPTPAPASLTERADLQATQQLSNLPPPHPSSSVVAQGQVQPGYTPHMAQASPQASEPMPWGASASAWQESSQPATAGQSSVAAPLAPPPSPQQASGGLATAFATHEAQASPMLDSINRPAVPFEMPRQSSTSPAEQEFVLAEPEVEEQEPISRVGTTAAHSDPSEAHPVKLAELLNHVLERGASDLHITDKIPPTLRINGELQPMTEYPAMSGNSIQKMIYAVLTQRQREKFEEELELDFAYTFPGKGRFRVNVYKQRNNLGAAFRLIPFEIKPLEALGVPSSVAQFASLARGFVLVTGPTGSGKSTTLASLVDLANRTRKDHILTVEDPIEFLHEHRSCVVNQREVGEDTHSFADALKHALRQDPDIILVGELRDLETISVALTAAETGHLVFATLHTQDAPQTIDRLIDVFPAHQQDQIRVQLAGALQGVVTQTLCKTADGRGRAVATEVLVATPAVRNLIREGKVHQIHSSMQAGAKFGMHTLDQHLADLVKRGRVGMETALEKCSDEEDFRRLMGQA